MAIIKPYSAFTTEDVTVSNYPCLVEAWTSDYGVAAGVSWTGRISGTIINQAFASSTFDSTNGCVIVGAAAKPYAGGVTGLLPGTDDLLIINVGYVIAGQGFGFGDFLLGSGQAAGVENGTSTSWVVTDSGATFFSEVPTIGNAAIGSAAATPGCFGIMVDWNGDAQDDGADTLGSAKPFKCTEAGVVTIGNAGTIGAGQNINAGLSTLTEDRFYVPGGATTAIYGTYILKFSNGLPPAAFITAMSQWMTSNPTKGLYPGLVGIE